jgi:adenosylcobinamide-GDP ribazoletransferase
MTKPPPGWPARRLDELILAVTLLTRIPMPPARNGDSAALGRAIWAYPLVGALIGAIGAAIFWLVRKGGLPVAPSAWVAIAAMILATGCFHEDGLADFWDGIGGGHTVERKLEIMRDSRIGSYGAAALIVALGLRATLIVALDASGHAEAGLVTAGLLGRSGIAAVLLVLPPARADGLAATAADPPIGRGLVALVLGFAVFGFWSVVPALLALTATALVAMVMVWLMHRQIEGYTGDGLGATEQKIEAAVLAVLAAAVA